MSDTPRKEYRKLSEAEQAELKFLQDAGEAFTQMILNLQTRRLQDFDKKMHALQQLSAGNPAMNDTLMRLQVEQAHVLRACDISQQRITEAVMWSIQALSK